MTSPPLPAQTGVAAPAATTRQSIIDAVLRIIGDDGVAALTNRRIAKEAGVSLGSVTYHFATQHELLREALLHFVSVETRRFTELADQCRGEGIELEGAARMVAQVAGGTAFDARHIAPFELYVQAGRDERLRAAAAECFAAYDRLAARILTGLGVRDAERMASTAVALVFGQQLRRLATGSPAEDLVDALLFLTRGSGVPEADG
ncbi:TetR family transcriptional regulator [Streptomyces sp. TRM66268-LWL]|uniref:TetR family transcriptional regulator n=1 Tax=Streptomyces polyasparticus TaxID=2767826 RepID=A0ABR7SJY4_9ACTN|nr:TetR/AcrR family transcriptional regulator [Streptomyces polyasparticus]MBC9715164.1 TetR family transcriptional regulator [Streptomyces polyasparticus]